MSDEIRDVTDDSGRLRAYQFLQRMIGDEPIDPIPSITSEQRTGRPSHVLHILDEQGIAGAVHLGPPYLEADQFSALDHPTAPSLLLEATRMLHSIAVRPDRRRSQLGRALLLEVETRARAEGALIIFGVASGPTDSDQFYIQQGYTVGPPATPLGIMIDNHVMVFPFESTDARWFVKIITPRPRGWRRLFLRAPARLADAVFIDPDKLEQLRA